MLAPLMLMTLMASSTPRQIVDLDHGWQFVRVKQEPSFAQFPDAMPTTNWKVVRVSSEETEREDGRVSNVFDGSPQTFWHTRWSRDPAKYPHELVVDLGSEISATGFRATPRQTGARNGLPKQFDVTLGDSPDQWGAPTVTGDFGEDFSTLDVPFHRTVKGRYLRFRALSGHDEYCVLSEIGLARPMSKVEKRSWASQYNIENINLGGAKYDLSGDLLEKVKNADLRNLESKQWETVTLPHTAHIEARDAKTMWQGVCFYRRDIAAPRNWRNKRVVLTLNGAMQVSDLWLNGKYIGGRRGGYLPVVVDLTGKLRLGATNALLVRLDCRDNPLVPPGKPWRNLDFSYYSGLYRDSFLTVTPAVHVTDPMLADLPKSGGIYVTFPQVAADKAQIAVRTHVANESALDEADIRVDQELFDSGGSKVAANVQAITLAGWTSHQARQSLTVEHPRLWSPEHPNLYRLVTTLRIGNRVVDRVDTRIGIRSIRFTRAEGLLLNGRPLRLVGTNRHQEYPYIGNALSRDMSYRDMWKIKDAGFNCVRLSHYPQDPAVMDACDELGILTIPPIAGWQIVNYDERFMKRVDQDIHELVRWHRNHPCVLMWEASLNETYVGPKIARRWNDAAHAEFIGGNFYTVGDSGAGQPWDMAYNGWDDATHSRPQSNMPDKPGYIREYGDYEFGGEGSTTRISRSQGEKAELQAAWNFAWSHNLNRGHYPWTIGDGTWVMYDYNRGCNPWLERSGIADNMRLPRFSYRFFQSQVDPFAPGRGPMVFIANYWTPRSSPAKVVVFSNCETVELRLNGQKIEERKPDDGPDTPYGDYDKGGNPWDGGNCRHLSHPVFTFTDVPFKAGSLEALGKIRGKVVTRSSVRTPGKAVALKLRVDLSGRPLRADGSDSVFVYAGLVDADGAVVTPYNGPVSFSSSTGVFLGESSVHAEAGTAAVLMRAGSTPGRILVRALTPEGLSGRLTVQSLPH
ncbi:MAG: glycoside hydrolase family 2 TIM barrel-domain containing protein [Fimbriimonas sp.]|nr:glycoside hydrolase family 2 TIM barrel-domain containing protein [Fimbriimonas sp.]